MEKSDLNNLEIPDTSGVYKFINASGGVLYVGKATSLRDRVRSYFGNDLIERRGMRLVDMVSQAHTIEWIETGSVLEALMLEAQLIKSLQPLYNVREKDNKSFYVIVITDEAYPRIFLERNRILAQKAFSYTTKKTYGPYTSGPEAREALKIIRKIFPFRSKKSSIKTTQKFYEQLDLEPTESQEVYLQTIEDISAILEGNIGSLTEKLEKRMGALAKKEAFEKAALVRNQIKALQHINDVSLIRQDYRERVGDSQRIEGYDISHLYGEGMVGVMTVIQDGMPLKSDYRAFTIRTVQSRSDDLKALTETLRRRLRHPEWGYPDLIVIDGGELQYKVGKRVLEEFNLTKKIDLVSVVKNEKHRPRDVIGQKELSAKYSKDIILLANSESHRFALSLNKKKRRVAMKEKMGKK